MLDNIDFDKLKKSKFKLIGTLAISSILVFNVTGCINNNEYITTNNNESIQKEVVVKAPCSYEIIGEENYYKDGDAPHFTIFKKKKDTGEMNVYSGVTCDGLEKSTSFSKGNYLLFSEDIGEIEFSIDDLDEDYIITVDYNNKTLSIDKLNENNLSR